MIYYSKDNIYLCDLSYLGAEILEVDESKKKQIITINWAGREGIRLLVQACPQGWHVLRGINVSIEEICSEMEDRFEARDLFPYYCFAKIRESKMRATRLARIVLFFLSALWEYRFLTQGTINYAVMGALALVMSIVTFFLPREILRKTFADYMADIERNGGPGPLDFHDLFN